MKALIKIPPAVAQSLRPAWRLCASAPLRWAFLCLFTLCTSALAQTAPTLIPFQGRLTDQAGRPYTNGQYTIVFTLYNLAVGGSALWTETHERVGVVNGMVNVFLGSINTDLSKVDFSQTKHLGITIDADNNQNTPDPEMVPRQMIIPAFWARQAENSTKLLGNDWSAILVGGNTNPVTGRIDGAKIGNSTISQAQIADGQITTAKLAAGAVTAPKLAAGAIGPTSLADSAVTTQKIADGTILTNDLAASVLKYLNPPGTIVAFGGNGTTPPPGWKFCNGDAVPIATYPDLYAAIGTGWGTSVAGFFKLPDLRGVFLRGKNWGRNDEYADPETSSGARPNPFGGNSGDNVGSFQKDQFKGHTHTAMIAHGQGAGSGGSGSRLASMQQTSSTGGDETRPKNAYVNYIIKY